LVDDEPDILESLGDLFAAALPDTKVVTAPSGDEALAILGKQPIDLIVSDFKMPGMNGLQFLEKARVMAPQVPRIMMTAFPDLDIAIAAINDARIETFFTKPLDPDRILAVVGQLLEGRRSKGMRDQALARALDEARRKASAAGGKP
jgi:DNA-binding NtrC family response regulator